MGLLSYSQLSTLRYCGEQLRLSKLGFPEMPAVYLCGGTAFHRTSEDIDNGIVGSVEEVPDLWHWYFEAELAQAREIEPDESKWRRAGRKSQALPNKEDVEFWRQAGSSWSVCYWEHRNSDEAFPIYVMPNGDPAIEVGFTWQPSEEYVVRGAIDRILQAPSGELVVCDLKTGKDPYDATQLGTYALAIEAMLGVRPTWGTYYLAREAGLGRYRNLARYTPEWVAHQYSVAHQMRKDGLYLANPGTHCIACGVREGCAVAGGSEVDTYSFLLPEY